MYEIAKLSNGTYKQVRITRVNDADRTPLPLSEQPDLPLGTVEIIELRFPRDAAELLGVTPKQAFAELRKLIKH